MLICSSYVILGAAKPSGFEEYYLLEYNAL
jgi:hypothetical protein